MDYRVDGNAGDSMGQLLIDGARASVADGASVAEVFSNARESVLAQGRVITDVRVGGEALTWQDGSGEWDRPMSESPDLVLTTDYPIHISSALLDRLASSLPAIGAEHRSVAGAIRNQESDGIDRASRLLRVWSDMEHAFDQICVFHDLSLDVDPWTSVSRQFQQCFVKLEGFLGELKESLELRDLVLAADLLEFELAPLAENLVDPCRLFQAELQRQFPAG